jgi:AraC family transcriptional regulator
VGIAVPVDHRCDARLAELRLLVQCARPTAPEWLERVRSILQQRYTHAPRLDSIARAVGRNADYITRAFRRQYGITPVEYVHRLRCEWVAEACVTSHSRLPELALAAGFSDQSHMTRVFTQYFGLPPARYRRSFRVTGDVRHEFAAVQRVAGGLP